jgi:pyruvate dehydrogenase E2 component (dihydrolipoamide acetyltransferase)
MDMLSAGISTHLASTDDKSAPYATPGVRRMARELGVDVRRVAGHGPHGRVEPQDVRAFVRDALARLLRFEQHGAPVAPPRAPIDFAKFGPVERKPLSEAMPTSGAKLAVDWSTIPHVTNFDEADVTGIEAFRFSLDTEAKADAEVTMAAFLVKALADALRRHPSFNASLDGADLILKKYIHIGFAVETPDGTSTPVLRNADRKSLRDIAREIAALSLKAREGALTSDDIEGGCMTITMHAHGVATPIVNAPELAILSAGEATTKAVWNGGAFAPRLILPLSLSWDHRALNGAEAARFLSHLCATLSDFRRMLL